VQAVFSRLNCNGGTCHGAVQGQNGFRLSLFGMDPVGDHERLLHELGGRRINCLDPARSLLLEKATGAIPHQGGKRTSIGSHEYEILLLWIKAGAPLDKPEESAVRELKVIPAEQVSQPGKTHTLKVQATFADGSTEDVTRFCFFEALDPTVATVDAIGLVQARNVGVTALVVRYRAVPALTRVLVPRASETPFPQVKSSNFVDAHVLERLKQLNVPPSELADDATFLRRISLDVAGELPTPQEVRAFLADKSADKRVRKIDELLQRPGHAALWTLKFCDLLKASDWGGFGIHLASEREAPRFQAWVRARLDENLPYDQFAERILTATSREGRSLDELAKEVLALEEGYAPGRKDLELYKARRTPDLYWQRNGASGISGTIQVAHAFLGLRLECAQCHRHPSDVWQQDDLLSFANFFMPVRAVGGDGQNEKKFPELAALQKSLDAQGKKFGEEVKKKRDTEGKTLDAEAKKAKSELDELTKKARKDDPESFKQIAERKAIIEKNDAFQRELRTLERRSKLHGEVGFRILTHDIHLVPNRPSATVTSPLGTQTSKQFRLLGQSKPVEVPEGKDPREVVVAWLRQPDNPYFAPALVNRVWANYFGRGLIEPADNLSLFNPATHPELLKELSAGFIKNKYDLRWLHRTILQSRTYQQMSMPTKENEADRSHYAYFPKRRLPAEVLIDAIDRATETTENMGMERYHWPEKMTAVEAPFVPENKYITFMLDTFGRPKRNSAVTCDCERDPSTGMLQVLSLANHPRVRAKIADPKGLAVRLTTEIKDDDTRLDELYLSTLSRLPSKEERAACQEYLKAAKTPVAGLQGILWSLLNTREFLLQH